MNEILFVSQEILNLRDLEFFLKLFSTFRLQMPYLKAAKFQTAAMYAHTIRKVKFLSKNSILTKPQHFHEFLTQKFWINYSLLEQCVLKIRLDVLDI